MQNQSHDCSSTKMMQTDIEAQIIYRDVQFSNGRGTSVGSSKNAYVHPLSGLSHGWVGIGIAVTFISLILLCTVIDLSSPLHLCVMAAVVFQTQTAHKLKNTIRACHFH